MERKDSWPAYLITTYLLDMYSIPDLKLYLFVTNVDHSGSKLHTDGEIMDRLESLICKLKEKAGFAHT